jgi:FG-GAP repeat protein
MRHGRYAWCLLAAGIVMLGTGLPLAGPAGASSLRSTAAAAPSPAQVAELTASDGAGHDLFGISSAITPGGNTALIGAAYRNGNTGAVYVFARTRSGWQQAGELTPSDVTGGDQFGFSVAISPVGNAALVGAIGHDGSIGAVYVFARTLTGWQQTGELTASDGASNNEFGASVAITPAGNTALIGAVGRDSLTGAAYVFALPPWWW